MEQSLFDLPNSQLRLIGTTISCGITINFYGDSEEELDKVNVIYLMEIPTPNGIYGYVGQTLLNLKRRMLSHCSDCWKRTDNSKKANAMRKYKAVNVAILTQCADASDVDREERKFIIQYSQDKRYARFLNTLLKTTASGQRVSLNKVLLQEHLIYQYSLDGKYVATYHSIRDAMRITGIGRNTISKCLHGKAKTGGGFQWRETYCPDGIHSVDPHHKLVILSMRKHDKQNINTETKEEKKLREQRNRGIRCYQYTLSGKLVAIHPSLHEAAKKTNIHLKAICQCCDGKYTQAGGFQFRKESSFFPIELNLMSNKDAIALFNVLTKGIRIGQFSLDGKLIKEYPSINQAKIETGFCGLGTAARENKISHGFIWKLL